MTARITSISDRFGRQVRIDEPMSHLAIHEIPTQQTTASAPFAVYTSFVVSPTDAGVWIENWARLARVAETWPGCRSFRIMRDRNDAMFVAAISEWETMDAYTAFTHETQGMALGQAMRDVCVPSEARFLDIIPPRATAKAAV
jgi:heme-degrading monooxygenase HmoA